MKNQYFGDKRDYFKYSLLESLVLGIPGIKQLTCVWMLTAPNISGDGRKPFVEHPDSGRLTAFLRDCRLRNERDVREMRKYFGGQGYGYLPYRDEPGGYFGNDNRADYFRNIPAAALGRAVVFFDPDNGLEPQGKVTSAHLKYGELREVFERMDADSIAVVYQHLPRVSGSIFWPFTAAKLSTCLQVPVAFVAESDLAFYVAPRDSSKLELAIKVLEAYKMRALVPTALLHVAATTSPRPEPRF